MIVSIDEAKVALGVTESTDDALIERLSRAAEARINALLGSDLDPENVPDDLRQAITLLLCHWYENREAALVGVSAQSIPHGVWDIVNEHRPFSFGLDDDEGAA
ncbi:MAG: head-tail connector protein [Pseudomonadota bacterium]